MAATEAPGFVPAEELGAGTPLVETPTTEAPAPPAFDPGALSEDQIAAVLAHERAKPLVDRIAQSEADRRFEAARVRAAESAKRAEAAQAEADRRKWVLEGDPDEVAPKLLEEERERAIEAHYAQRAGHEARAAAAVELYAALPIGDQQELTRLSAEVMAGRMSEGALWQEAQRRYGAMMATAALADRNRADEEERRLRSVEVEAERATAVRPRPDLGGPRGGGPVYTTVREVEAAFVRGEATSAEVRSARANLPY